MTTEVEIRKYALATALETYKGFDRHDPSTAEIVARAADFEKYIISGKSATA